ncbi:MAG: M23 family metallopeptidase [Leptospiraceae bacterium]|nr:M23 family metallopeptidase [Leptospiraceae bacterium]MCB1305374.1 M23 family metallopeptidase [Leptospiraceae bacterium]
MRSRFTSVLLFVALLVPTTKAVQGRQDEGNPRKWIKTASETSVAVPPGYRPDKAQMRVYKHGSYKLVLYSRGFATGDMVYAEIHPLTAPGKKPEAEQMERLKFAALKYNGINVALDKRSWGLRGLFAIYPHQKENGWLGWTYPLDQKSATGDEAKFESIRLKVHLTKFPVYTSSLKLGKYSNLQTYQKPEVLARIKEERTMKQKAFASREPNHIENRLSHPRDMHKVTSPFYATRVTYQYEIKNGKKITHPPKKYIHKGLDLRAWVGQPIYALAPGKVVLAHTMFFEGGFTVIDHGHGIMSGYMHQSQLLVKPGDMVQAGQLIGKAGATGMVTAAHLHLSLWVNGFPVDPLSLLSLPVR